MWKYIFQWAGVGILSLIGWGVDVMPENTSWIPSAIIWGIAFLWLAVTVTWGVKSWAGRKGIKVYANRAQLIKEKGQLDKELKGYPRVWVIWHEARVITESDVIKHCKLERVILTDPEDTYMMKRYVDRWGKLDQIDEEKVRLKSGEIRDTANKIKDATGAEVRFYSGATSCTLIMADKVKLSDDQFSDDAWARIESGIPFDDTQNRASVQMTKVKNPELLEALRQHYVSMWRNGRPL